MLYAPDKINWGTVAHPDTRPSACKGKNALSAFYKGGKKVKDNFARGHCWGRAHCLHLAKYLDVSDAIDAASQMMVEEVRALALKMSEDRGIGKTWLKVGLAQDNDDPTRECRLYCSKCEMTIGDQAHPSTSWQTVLAGHLEDNLAHPKSVLEQQTLDTSLQLLDADVEAVEPEQRGATRGTPDGAAAEERPPKKKARADTADPTNGTGGKRRHRDLASFFNVASGNGNK
jgi:hypothetical protein